jgi:predicted RNA methylase
MKPYALFPRTPGLFSSLNVQKNMLQDEARNRAFKEAIFRNVKKDDVVIDLGTGTGILAIWAAQAGARKVYAIEETDVADVAEAVIKDNGFQGIITVFKVNSSEVTLPEPADVLIAEVVGHFLFEEGIVEAIAGVRDALLKPDARIIPTCASVFAAPAELNGDFDEIKFWDTFKDPSLAAVREKAANSAYVETVTCKALVGGTAKLFDIDFTRAEPQPLIAETVFSIGQECSMDAIIGWFKLNLDADTWIDTSPWSPKTHWQQCVFPLEKPFELKEFQTLSLRMSIESFAPGAKWVWELCADEIGRKELHEFAITYGPGSRLLAERF